jgi:hypothetical protein
MDKIAPITPKIIPSKINGHRMKSSVAPTYFIMAISFFRAITVSFTVLDMMVIAMKESKRDKATVTTFIQPLIFDMTLTIS